VANKTINPPSGSIWLSSCYITSNILDTRPAKSGDQTIFIDPNPAQNPRPSRLHAQYPPRRLSVSSPYTTSSSTSRRLLHPLVLRGPTNTGNATTSLVNTIGAARFMELLYNVATPAGNSDRGTDIFIYTDPRHAFTSSTVLAYIKELRHCLTGRQGVPRGKKHNAEISGASHASAFRDLLHGLCNLLEIEANLADTDFSSLDYKRTMLF